MVKVYNEEIVASTTSAADGTFMIMDVPSGDTDILSVSARITQSGAAFYGWTEAGAVENGVTDAGPIVIDVLPSSGEPTTVQGQLVTLSGQPVGDARIVVLTGLDAYSGTARGGQYSIAGIPSDEGPIDIAATAVLDGGYLTTLSPSSTTPDAGDTTFIDSLLFDDLYTLNRGLKKPSRKLGVHAGRLSFGAGSEAVCRVVGLAGCARLL